MTEQTRVPMTPEAHKHEGLGVEWSCRYGPHAWNGPCPHEDCIEWERAEMVRLRGENERLRDAIRHEYHEARAHRTDNRTALTRLYRLADPAVPDQRSTP